MLGFHLLDYFIKFLFLFSVGQGVAHTIATSLFHSNLMEYFLYWVPTGKVTLSPMQGTGQSWVKNFTLSTAFGVNVRAALRRGRIIESPWRSMSYTHALMLEKG